VTVKLSELVTVPPAVVTEILICFGVPGGVIPDGTRTTIWVADGDPWMAAFAVSNLAVTGGKLKFCPLSVMFWPATPLLGVNSGLRQSPVSAGEDQFDGSFGLACVVA
jgi:hypothetical protein